MIICTGIGPGHLQYLTALGQHLLSEAEVVGVRIIGDVRSRPAEESLEHAGHTGRHDDGLGGVPAEVRDVGAMCVVSEGIDRGTENVGAGYTQDFEPRSGLVKELVRLRVLVDEATCDRPIDRKHGHGAGDEPHGKQRIRRREERKVLRRVGEYGRLCERSGNGTGQRAESQRDRSGGLSDRHRHEGLKEGGK